MAARRTRGGRYTPPGTRDTPRAGGPGCGPPRPFSPTEATALRERYATSLDGRGVGAGLPLLARDQVRRSLAEGGVQLARAGFCDDHAVELIVHGFGGHIDASHPSVVGRQVGRYVQDVLSGRHAH